MKILITLLPKGTDESQVREFASRFTEVTAVEITDAGDPERVTASIETPISKAAAEGVCAAIRRTPFNGHGIDAEPLLFFS
jgi:hypothetical protein